MAFSASVKLDARSGPSAVTSAASIRGNINWRDAAFKYEGSPSWVKSKPLLLFTQYEHGPWMARISQVYNKGFQTANPNQNGIPLAALFADSYRQWDFSSLADLSKLFGWHSEVQLTADATNLFGAKLRQYFQFSDATFTQYDPGRTITLGVRAKF